jgi:N-acetylglucosaminyldiphosphoundecaprenol N-acetyl-beta-D-mannosaminyltransferase
MSDYVKIGRISSSTETFDSIINQIIQSIRERSKHIFIHLNMHNFSILKNNPELLDMYPDHCKLFFEGIGMKVASVLTNQGWNNDTNGTDLFPVLFNHFSNKKMKVYLLGASQPVIEQVVINIGQRFPGVEIVGCHNGFIGFEEYKQISEQISNASPDLLVLGMGMKNEADFISANYNAISVGAIWCVGGLFDFISGNLIRAPRIIRKVRLEWLFRFLLEPKAKFKRTIITPFWFLITAMNEHYFRHEKSL